MHGVTKQKASKKEQFMTFEDWMKLRNLQVKSIKNYSGAINGSLSD